MALNPIQLSEIKAYLDIYGTPVVGQEVFIDLVGLMDMHYLELVNGDHKPASKRANKPGSRRV